MQIAGDSFTLHFICLGADSQREYVGAREHGVDFDLAAIQLTMPTALDLVQIEPVVLAVDGDVVVHEKQFADRRHVAAKANN